MQRPSISPMLAEARADVPESDAWALEAKFDGWRVFIVRGTGTEVMVLGGRNAQDYTGKLGYLETAARKLPDNTMLDGELIGRSWGDVQSAMTNIRTGGTGVLPAGMRGLTFVAFDVLKFNDTDLRQMPWSSRRQVLDRIQLPEHMERSPLFESTQANYDMLVGQGYEGVVCKRKNATYRGGKSSAMVKIKATDTVEAFVVGFKPGKGKRGGGPGALEIDLMDDKGERTGILTTAGSGLTDADVAAMQATPGEWLHKVVEIKHYGVQPSGKVRHPVFLRRRDDRATPQPATRVASNNVRRPAGRSVSSGPWMRNYGAMGDSKLLRCIRELRAGSGDAVERCKDRGGDLSAHADEAVRVAAQRGLPV